MPSTCCGQWPLSGVTKDAQTAMPLEQWLQYNQRSNTRPHASRYKIQARCGQHLSTLRTTADSMLSAARRNDSRAPVWLIDRQDPPLQAFAAEPPPTYAAKGFVYEHLESIGGSCAISALAADTLAGPQQLRGGRAQLRGFAAARFKRATGHDVLRGAASLSLAWRHGGVHARLACNRPADERYEQPYTIMKRLVGRGRRCDVAAMLGG